MSLIFQILTYIHLLRGLWLHEFHTSITQLEYNAQERVFEVSIRLFTDDLEKALSHQTKNAKLRIVNGDTNDALVAGYLQKHFIVLNQQKKPILLKYIGKENEDIATWVYLELPADAAKHGNSIQQAALFETFSDQVNIVNILNQGQKKSLVFDSPSQVKAL
jgi:hypothetical protein